MGPLPRAFVRRLRTHDPIVELKILFIQLKRIGDLILTTPAIAAVREKFPEAHLTLVISSESKALAPTIGGVNKLLVMPRGFGGIKTAAALAAGKFDYCLDFTRNDRSSLLVLLSRARKRIVSFRIKVRSKSEEHTSELQSPCNLVCRLLLEKKKTR